MPTVVINMAQWSPPEQIPGGWVIANAPRPIAGQITWTGDFRHGTFYAAAPPPGPASWAADDAWPVVLIDNAEVEHRVQAKLDKHGTTLADVGLTMAEMAYDMQLPYAETEVAEPEL